LQQRLARALRPSQKGEVERQTDYERQSCRWKNCYRCGAVRLYIRIYWQ
jgi:hypothetical protein